MHQIISGYHGSNTFIIEIGIDKVIIIDPGDPDIAILEKWLLSNNKTILAVFLTHEHGDHCAGVNSLYKLNPFTIFCSPECEKNMRNSKQNFSFYIDIIETFEVQVPACMLKDGQAFAIKPNYTILNLDSDKEILNSSSFLQTFTFYHTPGHSPGSACIINDNNIFTGDTILNKLKTPLKLPHSDKQTYLSSLQKLKPFLKKGMKIYPGHGEPYVFEDFNKLVSEIKINPF